MVKTKTFELIRNILLTLLTAAAVAIFMHVLVYPANFAPSGIDGLATMLQHVTGWNAGIFTLAINTPLLIAAWFVLKKRYVLYTVLYTIAFSAFLLLFFFYCHYMQGITPPPLMQIFCFRGEGAPRGHFRRNP